ncbi:MAG: hypothetical protein KGH81_05305 [Thaumarchaeota archaeon]|nr:hypothetical protein [Nitrososphaerota archaeon]MDE1841858.1 hypothetical protein [Nitrososphaerota archaeon]MDE1878180.1 hypothetical protein [Nitrososphaerota archaeon]
MKIQNKTVTAIMASLMIGVVLLSPVTVIPNVNAVPDAVIPPAIVEWQKSHPNWTDGCLEGDLKTHITKEIPCFDPKATHSGLPHGNSKPVSASGDFTYTVSNLDCTNASNGDYCWAGGQFSDNGPYNEILANTQIGSKPTNVGVGFWDWAGLTNCYWNHCPTNNILVQSGWTYQASKSASNPEMFTEIYGPFTYNGNNCLTFCGTIDVKSAGHNLYTSNFATSSSWTAYVQDNSDSTFNSITIPFTVTGVSNSVPYAMTSMEANDAPSKSYFSASPISLTSVTLYSPGHGQVPTNTNLMASYVGPLTGSLSVTYTATGTTTATATNTY